MFEKKTKNYLPSGLFGEVRNIHLGFSLQTTSLMRSTFKEKSGFLGTAEYHRQDILQLYVTKATYVDK